MNRCVVLVGRMLVVVAIIMSFAVTMPAAAEGLNTLTFRFSICPESEDTCTPYGNTDARIMELATGIEQWSTTDAAGSVTFAGLADGQYAFSTPAVAQKSISITCGDAATGMIVGSQMGENGPQVGLAGGQSISCSGVMIPYGPADDGQGVPAGDDVPADVVESVNSLTFSFEICPEASATCMPYGNTDARIMEIATGIEQWVVNDELGWASFGGLADGDYAFSVPAVAQESITFNCADETGAAVPSWMGDNGPTVSLSGGQNVACAGIMVPFGGGASAEEHPNSAIINIYTSECPASYTGGEYASVCGNPVDPSIYTAYIGYGTVPNSSSLSSALNDYGFATFDGLAADHYAIMVGSESAEVGAVSCQIFDGSTNGEGTWVNPPLGGRGYEIDLVEGGWADCSFYMIPMILVASTDEPVADTDEPVASTDELVATLEPATSDDSDEPSASGSARPNAQPFTGGDTVSTTPTSLPNTGTGAALNAVDGSPALALVGMVVGAVLLLMAAALSMRHASRR